MSILNAEKLSDIPVNKTCQIIKARFSSLRRLQLMLLHAIKEIIHYPERAGACHK